MELVGVVFITKPEISHLNRKLVRFSSFFSHFEYFSSLGIPIRLNFKYSVTLANAACIEFESNHSTL